MKGGIKAFKNARYLTRGVQSKIPVKLQIFMWSCIESVSEADYLQIFRLEPIETIQKITHEQEQPQFNRKYLIPTDHPIIAKVYIIDDGEHSIMLLANEYWSTKPVLRDWLFYVILEEFKIEENKIYCSFCKAVIYDDDYEELNGQIICDTCITNSTYICDCCGSRKWTENSYGNECTSLCSHCYNNHYTHCLFKWWCPAPRG